MHPRDERDDRRLLATVYKKLRDEDFKVLRTLEAGMKSFEYVPIEWIERRTRLPPHKTYASLSKLNNLKLVRRRLGSYTGYQLTWRGFDVLAIRALVERDILAALGGKIGVGKESDVYEGLAPGDKRVIVKVHRVGRTSFRQTARVRTYHGERPFMSWVEQSFTAAQREFIALNELLKVGADVPKPIGRSRHVVVTDYVEGALLVKVRELSDPKGVLERIMETVRKAYVDVGIVHGDLSEYNIMVEADTEKPYIIDWPQYVYAEHPSARSLLERDVRYVVNYFNRRFRLNLDYRGYLQTILTFK